MSVWDHLNEAWAWLENSKQLLEEAHEEVRRMDELGVGPDGRFDGDSYGNQQRSDGGQPILPLTGGVVDREGDVCDRRCCNPGVARIDPLEPGNLVVRPGLFSGGRMELDAELFKLLVEDV